MTDHIPAEAIEAARAASGAKGREQASQIGVKPNTEARREENARERMRAALEAALPFIRPEPSVSHRPGDEVDGTVYCSCGDGDYGSEGHRSEPSEDEREVLGAIRTAQAQAMTEGDHVLADQLDAAAHYVIVTRRRMPSREQVKRAIYSQIAFRGGDEEHYAFMQGGMYDAATDAVLALFATPGGDS